MADIAAAREEVQKVVAFLVNRFGHEADVFKHLTLALSHLQDEPAPQPEPAPEAQSIVQVVGEPEPESKPEPKPRPYRRRHR